MESLRKYRLLFLILIFSLCFVFPSLAQEENKGDKDKELKAYLHAKEILPEGSRLLKDGKCEESKKIFVDVLGMIPNHTEALFCLGVAHYHTSDLQNASTFLHRAIDEYPAWHEHRFKMKTAHYHYAQSRITEIEYQMRQLLGDANYNIYRNGGLRGLHSVPREDAARIISLQRELTEMEEVLLPNPTKAVTPAKYHYQAGNCLLRLKKYNEAHQQYMNAIATDPKHGEAHNNLAYIYFLAKKYEKAWEHLQSAKRYGAKVNPQAEAQLKKILKK